MKRTITYHFSDDFEYELSESQINEFFANKYLEETQVKSTKETRLLAEYIVEDLEVAYDDNLFESNYEEMKDYFERDAEDSYDELCEFLEDQDDDFGA